MDPEQLFFLDKKVVKDDRRTSLAFSLAIAFFLVLVDKHVIKTYGYSSFVIWFTVVLFTALGFLQFYWDPYTRRKVLGFNITYALSASLLSIYVTGFINPMVFLGWLMLVITTAIYFKHWIWYGIYGIFLASVAIWLIKESAYLDRGDNITILGAAMFVGLVSFFISSVWDLFNRSVRRLNASQTSEKLVSERLGSLINSMVDGVVATDEAGRIVLYNGAALNVLDLNIDLHGKTFSTAGKFIDPNNQEIDIDKFIRETKSQVVNREYRLRYSDGSLINLYISIAPVRLGFGHAGTEGFVILFRDITREKSLEEERDEFISVVSHELRTPIAIAEGEVSNAEFIAKSKKAKKEMTDALKQAHEQILFLSNMINDLSTLSRAERGMLNVEIENIDCHELMKEFESDYLSEMQAKGLELKLVLDPDAKILKSSKLYVREILQNFITNAIKYTEKGSITIEIHSYEKGIVFQVKDTGIGINKGDQEKIFDKFFRSEDYRTRATNGTGLGLYVTMKLTKLIKAEISLQSELNKGSTFTIKVPNLS